MATNWSSSSGFGGGLGGSNLGRKQGGTGSGIGSSVGNGLSDGYGPWRKAPLNPTGTTTPAYTPIYDQPTGPGKQYGPISAPAKQYGGNPYDPATPAGRSEADKNYRARLADPLAVAETKNYAGDHSSVGYSLSDLFNTIAGQYQPQRDDIGVQRSVLDKRAAIDERGLGLRRGELTSNASFDRQRLGLKLQDLGIDRQGNALKLAGLGIDRKDNTSERGYITRLRELAGLSNTNASNRISFEGQDKARGIKSNYITGGTTFSPGHTYDQGANYLRTLSDLESQDLGYKKEVAGFDRRDEGLNLSDERIGLSEQEVGLANQKLDLMASNLGIDRAQLEDGLNRGLKQLGLEGEINALELISAQSRLTGEEAGLVGQMISDLYAHGLQPGDLMQGFNQGTLKVF